MEHPKLELGLSPALQQQLEAYRNLHHHQDLESTMADILDQFFTHYDDDQTSHQRQLQNLETKLDTFARELVTLRQQVPQDYDQLRGQLAAIHLSHSGLLRNLRERLEVLEAFLHKGE